MLDQIAQNKLLIEVLKEALWRAEERKRRIENEIFKLKLDLAELGVELPLED